MTASAETDSRSHYLLLPGDQPFGWGSPDLSLTALCLVCSKLYIQHKYVKGLNMHKAEVSGSEIRQSSTLQCT